MTMSVSDDKRVCCIITPRMQARPRQWYKCFDNISYIVSTGAKMLLAISAVNAACLEEIAGSNFSTLPDRPSSFKETKCFFPAHSWWFNIAGSLRDQEVACSASDRQGPNFESCVWRAVSAHSFHHPQDVLLAQFSLNVAWNPIHFISFLPCCLFTYFDGLTIFKLRGIVHSPWWLKTNFIHKNPYLKF